MKRANYLVAKKSGRPSYRRDFTSVEVEGSTPTRPVSEVQEFEKDAVIDQQAADLAVDSCCLLGKSDRLGKLLPMDANHG